MRCRAMVAWRFRSMSIWSRCRRTRSTGRRGSARCGCAMASRWRRCCTVATRRAGDRARCRQRSARLRGGGARLMAERWDADAAHVERLWARAVERLRGWTINGAVEPRYRGNLNVRCDGLDVARLMSDCRDIAFSAGSACASGSGRSSHVLRALGLSESQARSSIRLGWGRYTTRTNWCRRWRRSPRRRGGRGWYDPGAVHRRGRQRARGEGRRGRAAARCGAGGRAAAGGDVRWRYGLRDLPRDRCGEDADRLPPPREEEEDLLDMVPQATRTAGWRVRSG